MTIYTGTSANFENYSLVDLGFTPTESVTFTRLDSFPSAENTFYYFFPSLKTVLNQGIPTAKISYYWYVTLSSEQRRTSLVLRRLLRLLLTSLISMKLFALMLAEL